MGMVETYYYHVWGNKRPVASYSRVISQGARVLTQMYAHYDVAPQ